MSLEVRHLSKSYGKKVVVEDLSFSLGTNGAGKTTTIRMILGMLKENGGEVLWNGKRLDPMQVNIGYLAEERGLYPKYTLMDQLLYFGKLKKVPKDVCKKRIAHWAKRLDVAEYIYGEASPVKTRGFRNAGAAKPKTADQLSKGNQQKIQLMAALISDPELIVLHEPWSGLDPVNTDLFKEIIREEIAKGKYIINIKGCKFYHYKKEIIHEFIIKSLAYNSIIM